MRRTLLAGAAVMLWAFPAGATLQLAADFGGTMFACADNAPCDTNGAVGTLQIADQLIGGVQVNGSIQTSTKGTTNILNTSSLSAINKTGDSVLFTIAVGDKDFIGPVSEFLTSGSGVFQTAIGSFVTMNWYNDPENRQGAGTPTDTPGILIDTFSKTVTADADSFAHNGSGPTADPDFFSMTLQETGKLVADGQFLNNGSTEIKPQAASEPRTLGILGVGLAGIWFMRRQRKIWARSVPA